MALFIVMLLYMKTLPEVFTLRTKAPWVRTVPNGGGESTDPGVWTL